MPAIAVDSQGHAAQEGRLSAKAAARAAVTVAALSFAALGAYWLATASPAAPETPAATARSRAAGPAPVAAEPFLKAPAATCVDGRPASDDVPADSCR